MSAAIDSTVQQARFLAAFAASASLTKAARWAKLSRQAHYNWMALDPTYPDRFEAARRKAAQTLEDEAVRRAHDGLRKAVRYKGRIVGYDTEYSDSLMLALLKANAPDKFKETLGHRFVDASGKDRTLDVAAVRAYMNSIPDDDDGE